MASPLDFRATAAAIRGLVSRAEAQRKKKTEIKADIDRNDKQKARDTAKATEEYLAALDGDVAEALVDLAKQEKAARSAAQPIGPGVLNGWERDTHTATIAYQDVMVRERAGQIALYKQAAAEGDASRKAHLQRLLDGVLAEDPDWPVVKRDNRLPREVEADMVAAGADSLREQLFALRKVIGDDAGETPYRADGLVASVEGNAVAAMKQQASPAMAAGLQKPPEGAA